ncbi:MAG: RNA-binding S4 domain-containing protein [Myxococcota bacterium]
MPDEMDSFIRLDQLLKREGLVGTGGQAKWVIQEGDVKVNGAVETRRGRKLRAGDKVEYEGHVVEVDLAAK